MPTLQKKKGASKARVRKGKAKAKKKITLKPFPSPSGHVGRPRRQLALGLI